MPFRPGDLADRMAKRRPDSSSGRHFRCSANKLEGQGLSKIVSERRLYERGAAVARTPDGSIEFRCAGCRPQTDGGSEDPLGGLFSRSSSNSAN
jgi:hypothetical protein